MQGNPESNGKARMKILKLDKTGHSTLCATEVDIQAEFNALIGKGYAMFLNDEQLRTLDNVHPDAEILALAPLVGG